MIIALKYNQKKLIIIQKKTHFLKEFISNPDLYSVMQMILHVGQFGGHVW